MASSRHGGITFAVLYNRDQNVVVTRTVPINQFTIYFLIFRGLQELSNLMPEPASVLCLFGLYFTPFPVGLQFCVILGHLSSFIPSAHSFHFFKYMIDLKFVKCFFNYCILCFCLIVYIQQTYYAYQS
jgi:hypothetical protein